MPKFGIPMSKSKDILPDSNPWWKHNFDIEVKGQGHTEFMNVGDTLYHGDTLTWQTKYDYVKGQNWGLNTKPCYKPYYFDLEVKGQCPNRIMNALDTSSHGDRPMCQIWYANVKANRRRYDKSLKIWSWGQRSTSNMNVHVTYVHGDRPMCQIW